MKLMRGYRFRREAFRMLKAFLIVFVGAFGVEAAMDWAKGRAPAAPLVALSLSALVFMLIAAVLFAVDTVIQSAEKKHKPFEPAQPQGPHPR